MATFILLLILSVSLSVDASYLDDEFNAFLRSPLTAELYQDNSAVVKNLFKLYKNEFNRPSMTSSEENSRYTAFRDTIMGLHKDYEQGKKTYTVGLNEYTDWTLEDLRKLNGVRRPHGVMSSTNAKSDQVFLTLHGKKPHGKLSALPSSLDYTTELRPVKNQDKCASCYAFAFITLLEFQYARFLKSSKHSSVKQLSDCSKVTTKCETSYVRRTFGHLRKRIWPTDDPEERLETIKCVYQCLEGSGTDLSEQQMVDCSTLDHGCKGGYFTTTFEYLAKNRWQVNRALVYPYTAIAAKCTFKKEWESLVDFGPLLYRKIPDNNANAMIEALVNYGPLWAVVFVTNDVIEYKRGVLSLEGCLTSFIGRHAVVIVGYGVDTKTGSKFWKVRNSWGSTWGEQGYFRIERGVNMCGIESEVFYIGRAANLYNDGHDSL